MQKSYDVIVVGSGFGGGTVAMRLARAGKHVCVLERGRRWSSPPKLGETSFFWGRQIWRPLRQRLGLYELRQMLNLQGLVGAGVGGGSLVWAKVVIEAPEWVFRNGWPQGITRESLDRYYQLARPFLHASFTPTTRRSELLKQSAEAIGSTWSPVNVSRAVTYIAEAEASGAEVHPLHLVTGIEPLGVRGYRVHFKRFSEDGRVEEVSFADAQQVVVSAGTFGTNELLLRAKSSGQLPHLSDALGNRFSVNGNVLSGALGAGRPVVDANELELPIGSMINFGSHVVEDYANPTWTAGIVGSSNVQRILSFALALVGVQPTEEKLRRMAKDLLVYVGVGTDGAKGRLRLNRAGMLSLDWPGGINSDPIVVALHHSMSRMAAAIGRRYVPNVFSIFNRPLTYHPLGGCAMADSAAHGVVNSRGEVHGYPNLFVADGSIVPTALGRNPSYTIAALAELIAEGMISRGQKE